MAPRSAAISALRLGPLSEMYSVFSSGESARPLGLKRRGHERDDDALEVDQEDALEIELARLVADIAGVGNIDTPGAIDGDVVGAVEPLAFVVVGERADRAVAVVIETRRPPPVLAPSATISRPSRSKIRPLARPLGSRNTVVCRSSGRTA